MYEKILLPLLLMALVSCSQNTQQSEAEKDDSMAYSYKGQTFQVKENPLKEAYFGEEHRHTAVSMDAFIAGTRLTPDDAYRFAQGAEIMVR